MHDPAPAATDTLPQEPMPEQLEAPPMFLFEARYLFRTMDAARAFAARVKGLQSRSVAWSKFRVGSVTPKYVPESKTDTAKEG